MGLGQGCLFMVLINYGRACCVYVFLVPTCVKEIYKNLHDGWSSENDTHGGTTMHAWIEEWVRRYVYSWPRDLSGPFISPTWDTIRPLFLSPTLDSLTYPWFFHASPTINFKIDSYNRPCGLQVHVKSPYSWHDQLFFPVRCIFISGGLGRTGQKAMWRVPKGDGDRPLNCLGNQADWLDLGWIGCHSTETRWSRRGFRVSDW